MSTPLIILLLCLLVAVFSQFGGLLRASNAGHWWLVALFILGVSINPEILRPFADFLGIQFISNFVLASLVMFLFMQGLSSDASSIKHSRKFRDFVSNETFNDYFLRNSDLADVRVLIILPTFNEELILSDIAAQLINLQKNHPNYHFCFIDDHSKDKSLNLLKTFGNSHYARHLANIGVSGVLTSGFKIARELNAGFLVQCDSDGQHPISMIPKLVESASLNSLDCCIGSRFYSKSILDKLKDESTTMARVFGGQFLSLILNTLFSIKISDPTSGFRVYSQRAISELIGKIPDDYPEPESIAILSLSNLKIQEIQIEMLPRRAGKSSIEGVFSIIYMLKVISALIGLRLRSIFQSSQIGH